MKIYDKNVIDWISGNLPVASWLLLQDLINYFSILKHQMKNDMLSFCVK